MVQKRALKNLSSLFPPILWILFILLSLKSCHLTTKENVAIIEGKQPLAGIKNIKISRELNGFSSGSFVK